MALVSSQGQDAYERNVQECGWSCIIFDDRSKDLGMLGESHAYSIAWHYVTLMFIHDTFTTLSEYC